MREITYEQIAEAVSRLCVEANVKLGEDVQNALRQAKEREQSPVAGEVLSQLLQNAAIAADEYVPMCQDTGMAVFRVELGQDCRVAGGSLYAAINEGVRRGYRDGYLRASVVRDPLQRVNTGDNTPAVIHVELVEGDSCTIYMTAKGFGSENMSRLQMLAPSDGMEGVKRFVVETVRLAGPNACPPVVVGVGLGGNFELAAYLAKKALFRPIGERHQREDLARLELELMESINRLGIGPQGMGGSTTALDVHVELYATHIAALPVAVNINCHASRHKHVVL